MHNTPGFSALTESFEAALHFPGKNGEMHTIERMVTIGSTAVDAGNTPTTDLRAGLLIGKKTSDGNYYQYDPDGTDGTENPVGWLANTVPMLNDVTHVAEDQSSLIVVRGNAKEADILLLDEYAKTILMAQGCLFDAIPYDASPAIWTRIEYVSGNVTVVAADNGTLFIVTGGTGVTFTLPTLASGLGFWFANDVDQSMIINGASDIIGLDSLVLDTITYSTANEQIGALCQVRSTYSAAAALKWRHINQSPATAVLA